MNVLPTSPETADTPEHITQYFEDMRRWNFDVAYNAFYAFPLAEVRGRFKEPYRDFVRIAHEHGLRACVQIQSTVGFLDDVGIENAQYYADNTTYIYRHFIKYGKKNFFGSYAAPGWLEYIKTITDILRDYGYDWVVFEEPMFRADIPGTKDKFYERFKETYPDLEYPTRQDDSVAYQRVQELKSRVLLEFYQKLCAFAKKIGFEKCGIVPWFFVPTFENTPMESWNTCCHLGKLTFLPELDFIVVRMQPDNVYAEATIASRGEGIPQIAYLENLSQNLGKPIISVNNPTNEHIRLSADTPDNILPYGYFARFTLAAAAAVPNGMTRHWYKKDYENDKAHMDLMTHTNRYLPRLGSPHSPVALVFSHTGMNRTVPRPWTEAWKSYWFLAHHLLYEEKYPALTFFADTLSESLQRHPETQLLIFGEYFPIPPDEINLIEEWLNADPSHRILYIGARNGYRYAPDALYHDFEHRPPEMLRLFGCETDKKVRTSSPGEYVRLELATTVAADAFLGISPVIRCCACGSPAILKDADIDVLYTAGEQKEPVIFRRKTENGGYALYVGLSTDGTANDLPLRRIVDVLLNDAGIPLEHYPLVKRTSRAILWNRTANKFVFIANCDDENGRYKILRSDVKIWDVRSSAMLPTPAVFSIPPFDFHVLKILEKGDRLLDVQGQIYLTRIEEKSDGVKVAGYFQKTITAKFTQKPSTVSFSGEEIPFTTNATGEVFIIKVELPATGDGRITFSFDT